MSKRYRSSPEDDKTNPKRIILKYLRFQNYCTHGTYKNWNVGSIAKSHVQHGTILGKVDLLAAEHGGGGLTIKIMYYHTQDIDILFRYIAGN
jgi:hypothetical protein